MGGLRAIRTDGSVLEGGCGWPYVRAAMGCASKTSGMSGKLKNVTMKGPLHPSRNDRFRAPVASAARRSSCAEPLGPLALPALESAATRGNACEMPSLRDADVRALDLELHAATCQSLVQDLSTPVQLVSRLGLLQGAAVGAASIVGGMAGCAPSPRRPCSCRASQSRCISLTSVIRGDPRRHDRLCRLSLRRGAVQDERRLLAGCPWGEREHLALPGGLAVFRAQPEPGPYATDCDPGAMVPAPWRRGRRAWAGPQGALWH
jgi:hypothetical protein